MNIDLVKKFLAPFLFSYQKENRFLFLMNEEQIIDFFLQLSIGNTDIDVSGTAEELMFEKGSWKYSRGRLIDTLIYYGIDVSIVGLVFSLMTCIVFLVFCKQVVGVACYGLYYPLLTALCIYGIGTKFSGVFFIFALVAYILYQYLIEGSNILIYAKMGLYLLFYLLVTLFLGGIYATFREEYIGIGNLGTILFITSYIIIGLSGKKVFSEGKAIISFKRRLHLFRFLALSYFLYFLLTYQVLQQYLLIHSRIVFLCIIGTFFLGKFTGLQVVEYIRFRGLIKQALQKKFMKK